MHKPSGLSAPGCSGGDGGFPPVSAGSDGLSGIPAAVHQTHSGQISLHLPHWAKTTHAETHNKRTDSRLTAGWLSQVNRVASQFSRKGSLKVHLMCSRVSPGLNWGSLTRGNMDKLARWKSHTSFLLLCFYLCEHESRLVWAWSTHRTLLLLLWNAVLQFQQDSIKASHPLSLYCTSQNIMKQMRW